jgi:hypothetical protein
LNIGRWLEQLQAHRTKINAVIATLEELERFDIPLSPTGKRGRKFMGVEERRVVSDRMRRDWEARKK